MVQQQISKPTAHNEKEIRKIAQRVQNKILHGTAEGQSRDMTFAADVDLVAYGVATQITGT